MKRLKKIQKDKDLRYCPVCGYVMKVTNIKKGDKDGKKRTYWACTDTKFCKHEEMTTTNNFFSAVEINTNNKNDNQIDYYED